MNSLRASSSAAGFTLSTPVLYANVHNQGATITTGSRQMARYRGRVVKMSRYDRDMDRRRQAEEAAEEEGRKPRLRRSRYSIGQVSGATFNIPQRQFIPDAHRHLPSSWRSGFVAVFRVMRDEALKGR
jgi:hypothetical protein